MAARHPKALSAWLVLSLQPHHSLARFLRAEPTNAGRLSKAERCGSRADHSQQADLEQSNLEQVIEDTLGCVLATKESWAHRVMIADISAEARNINVPTKVIVGEEDVVETAP